MFPLKDTASSGKFPFWVVVIILFNVYIFYLELTAVNPDTFINHYALIPSLVHLGNPSTFYPFFTSQFLHGGFLHIISNMWFLWIFGDNVEDRLGFFVFPVFYLAAGIAGASLQYILSPTSDIPMLGASGAIAGVLGAYFALFPRNTVKTLVFFFFFISIIDIPASFMLFYWFVIQLFSGGVAAVSASAGGGIAYFAHVGGFAAGYLAGKTARVIK